MNDMKNSGHLKAYPKKWNKPPDGWIKINIDDAMFNEGFVDIYCIMRDSNMNILRAKSGWIEGIWKPGEEEALSLEDALSWTKSLNLRHCIFKTD